MIQRTSVRTKLIVSSVTVISLTFALVLAVVAIISVRSNTKNLKATELTIRTALNAKGKVLVLNNSMALRGMAQDNAVVDIRNLVKATVMGDSDIVYGIYLDKDRKPWVNALKGKIDAADGDFSLLSDTMSMWASTITVAAQKVTHLNGQQIIEFASPVQGEDETLGFIRYGLTTKAMYQALDEAKKAAFNSLVGILAILGFVALVALLVAFTATRRLAEKITSPIKALVLSAQQIADGNYSIEIKPQSDDEIGTLSTTFDIMRLTVKKYTEGLQEMIDEKMRQVRDIMNNIDQGIFTVNTDMSINPEYSIRSNALLGFENIAASPLPQVLRLDAEGANAFDTWMRLVFASYKKLRWAKLTRLAPVSELIVPNARGTETQYIKIEYGKVLDKQGELAKIMVMASDITEARKTEMRMEEERLRHESEVKMILGIVNNPPEIIADFIGDTEKRLGELVPMVQGQLVKVEQQRREFPDGPEFTIDEASLHALYRDFHTIKGNAGSYGFDLLSVRAHESENLLEKLKVPVTTRRSDLLQGIIANLDTMKINLEEIRQSARRLAGGQDEVVLQVPQSKVKHILNLCNEFKRNEHAGSGLALVDACNQISYKPMDMLTKKYRDLVKRVSEKLNKKVQFKTSSPWAELHPETFHDVDEALVHILRNAVDHGIESLEERAILGKETGIIGLKYYINESDHMFEISDDGRGINLETIKQKAIENRFITSEKANSMSEAEALQLIFLPGLTTAMSVTSISGRGVGMDAAFKAVLKAQGTISIKTVFGKGTTITIALPFTEVAEEEASGQKNV
jgi:two-component system chemotaxis sensor kinase CheA